MRRIPSEIIPRRDFQEGAAVFHKNTYYSVEWPETGHSYDSKAGTFIVAAPPPGGNLCTERVTLHRGDPRFRISWDWEYGSFARSAALVYLLVVHGLFRVPIRKTPNG